MTGKQKQNDSNTGFLIITKRGFPWINALRDTGVDVTVVTAPDDCDEALATLELDIIIYDDETFDMPATKTIEEIRLQKPQSLLAIISSDLDADYYEELIAAGAVDAMSTDNDTSVMLRRARSLMRQSQKKSATGIPHTQVTRHQSIVSEIA